MEELSSEGEFSFGSQLSSTSATSPGPYFLFQDNDRTFYVNGKEVLKSWVKRSLEKPAEMMPLLVSHPLRDTLLEAKIISSLQAAGFDLDELEKNFWVVRAIPTWLRGLPLETGISACLVALNVKAAKFEDFSYESLSPGKWKEIWDQLSVSFLFEHRLVIEITPGLFK
jgi:hypothetical protein